MLSIDRDVMIDGRSKIAGVLLHTSADAASITRREAASRGASCFAEGGCRVMTVVAKV